jgi:hypothetical protein
LKFFNKREAAKICGCHHATFREDTYLERIPEPTWTMGNGKRKYYTEEEVAEIKKWYEDVRSGLVTHQYRFDERVAAGFYSIDNVARASNVRAISVIHRIKSGQVIPPTHTFYSYGQQKFYTREEALQIVRFMAEHESPQRKNYPRKHKVIPFEI